MIKKV